MSSMRRLLRSNDEIQYLCAVWRGFSPGRKIHGGVENDFRGEARGARTLVRELILRGRSGRSEVKEIRREKMSLVSMLLGRTDFGYLTLKREI
jgi:hypothetical protein